MGDQSDPSHAKPLMYADKLVGKKTLPTTSYDLSLLPNPTVKEGKPAVIIPEDFYQEGCEIWKFSLTRRLDFTDIIFSIAKKTLESQWQLGDGRVQFIPMVRGFFIIKLKSQEDKDKLFDAESWIVEHQKLSLLEWYPSFDPQRQKTSHASAWVKFPGLPMEFWLEKTLLSMEKYLGTPIVVDKCTLAHEYGYYASVLIDINFAELDTDGIHVTVGGLDFWQLIDIYKKPKFCTHCKIIGHNDGECRKKQNSVSKQQRNVRQQNNQQLNIVVKNVSGVSKWHPKKNGINSTIKHGNSHGSVGDNKKEAGRKKKGNKFLIIPFVPEIYVEQDDVHGHHWGAFSQLNVEDYTLENDVQHNGTQQFEFSSENLELLAHLKAQVEQGVELSAEEHFVLELGKNKEEDLANLKKIREDLERTTRRPTNSGVLSPNKFFVLQEEVILSESKEVTGLQTHLDSVREVENFTDSVCSESNLGLQVAQPKESSASSDLGLNSKSMNIRLTSEENEVLCTITKFDVQ
ncbi:uncharacterized protein LOC113273071 [Papaver somniferum]|uniref:uncharacterized protein LOC113273071 n=1 Tax=Papaver somniferum TaxID=3469 RepID=UPI000E705E6F|nr:uncharacterized protein LOC113273071 [Papaver somniferum]